MSQMKNRIVNQLESDENSAVVMNSIDWMQLDNCMAVDPTTMEALQIFRAEDHPR
jgi:hypothetical protein